MNLSSMVPKITYLVSQCQASFYLEKVALSGLILSAVVCAISIMMGSMIGD
jgi:hypothetical protein